VDRRTFLRGSAVAAAGIGLVDTNTLTAAAAPAVAQGAGARVPSGLLAALLDDPLGVATSGLKLSWQVPAIGSARQVAYQIQLGAAPAGRLVWDSGRVAGAASTAVAYTGPGLAPATPYWWRVRTWDASGPASAWSAAQRVVTAAGNWTGTPIWAPADTTTLTDGTLTAEVAIETVSAGFWLRAQDSADNYLWQVFAGSPGRIRTHVFRNGGYTVLADHALTVDVPTGTPITVAIQLAGAVITTSINGVRVDQTTDATYASGTIGLRNGSTESQRYQRITFTEPDGTVRVSEDFTTGPGVFAGGTVDNGDLVLGKSQTLLAQLAQSHDWALLRTEFPLPVKPVLSAFVQATGQSPEGARQYVYKLWANGRVIGRGPVRAMAGEARYHTHDVTSVLRPGRNALAALCYSASGQVFQAQLVVVFADGTRQVVGSGPGWRALRGAELLPYNGYTGGGYFNDPQEFWDARAEPVGWTEPGFDDRTWLTPGTGTTPAELAPATVNLAEETIVPAAVTQTSPGNWLVDLGREIAGGLRLQVTGKAGSTVTVSLGEELNSDNVTVRYQLRAGNTYREVWTLRDGWQQIEHWGYRGFRWAQLTTDPDLDLSHAVIGVALHLPWHDEDSAFDCDNPDLTRVWEFARYSIKATALDTYQDTPTRERGPYEGDAFINQKSQYAVQRSFGLARYSNSLLCRRPSWPTEYHLMSVLSAWADYLATGDADGLAADYEYYVAKNFDADLGPDNLVHKAPGSSGQFNGDLVDWPATDRDGYVFTDVNTVVNAFQAAAYATLAQVAGVLGRSADVAEYNQLADRVRSAINTTLLPTGASSYVDGSGTTHTAQHATAFPVALGIAPGDRLSALGQFLADGGMRTSVYGAQFLLDALFATGQADAAHALLTATGDTSWLAMLDQWHATIVMEAWNPTVKPNTTFSHAWGSAPANVVAGQVLGVQVTAPGAAEVRVRPHPGPLHWMRGTVPTIRGPVSVALDRRQGFALTVDLPPNSAGRIELDTAELGVDGRRLSVRAPGRTRNGLSGNVFLVDGVPAGRTEITG
jgi:alpha-L-rhamnosidase